MPESIEDVVLGDRRIVTVTGIERHPVMGAPESPAPGESVGILVSGLDADEVQQRLDDGEVLYLRQADRPS